MWKFLYACFVFIISTVAANAAMEPDAKIWVAGHSGLVGSAIVRALKDQGYSQLILKSREELDLLDQTAVKAFYEAEKPDYVFVAAAKVGGIFANQNHPVDFLSDNLQIALNIINGAHAVKVKKLLYLGSSCIYPRECNQPIKEDYLLTGPLEPTNEWYATAKIAGLKLCQAYSKQYGDRFISLMPTNLYGPGDNFDLMSSHVIPALIRKFVDAKIQEKSEVVVWGSGKPLREFLFVDDLAEACLFAMNQYDGNEWLNVGTGTDVSIAEVAKLIAEIVGYSGNIVHDQSKPDGTPRKLLDVSKIQALGWQARTPLHVGLKRAIEWYIEQELARKTH